MQTIPNQLPMPSTIEASYQKHEASLREISLKIHEYSELAFHEYKSSALLCKFLEEQGFSVEKAIAGDKTAFVGTFSQGGPTVSFNAVFSK
jgi:aminobenzoyl-glutamate utilization protein B